MLSLFIFKGTFFLINLILLISFVSCKVESTEESPQVTPATTYYTVTFDSNGGSEVAKQTVESGKVATKPENPTKAGYAFGGWYSGESEFDFSKPITQNLTLVAMWKEGEVNYTVKHFQQNLEDNDYTEVVADRQTPSGKTGAQTQAEAKSYEGFTAKNFEQKAIATDESTVIEIYYDRNIITLTFDKADSEATWSENWANQASDGKITISGKYGAQVTAPEVPKKTGYGSKWNGEVQSVFTGNETYTAVYPEGEVNYKVEHWKENANNDEYTLFETTAMTGKTGANTEAQAESYEGFESPSATQTKIAADGSTVVEIKYSRKRFAVTFDTDGGSEIAAQTVKYGAKASEPTSPTAPTKDGYDLVGWFTSTDGGSTLSETAFDFDTEITQDTTLYAKWEKTFTITFNSKGGSEVESQKVKYGEKVVVPTAPTRGHYDFVGWYTSTNDGKTLSDEIFNFSTEEIKQDTTLYANWKYINYGALIRMMKESGTIKITGEDSGIFSSALQDLYKSKPEILVTLDFMDAENFTSIENSAFEDGMNLKAVIIPNTVTSIGEKAFSDCWALTNITIPDSVTKIRRAAFYGCSKLTEINIPKGVTTIYPKTFYECSALKSITIPENVTDIGDSAFMHCESLKSITVPENVTKIGKSAFAYCKNLTSITIPAGVTNIGSEAFEMCVNLTDITFLGTKEQWENCTKSAPWKYNSGVPATKVVCSDGEVSLQ